jgi:hypothetical protein
MADAGCRCDAAYSVVECSSCSPAFESSPTMIRTTTKQFHGLTHVSSVTCRPQHLADSNNRVWLREASAHAWEFVRNAAQDPNNRVGCFMHISRACKSPLQTGAMGAALESELKAVGNADSYHESQAVSSKFGNGLFGGHTAACLSMHRYENLGSCISSDSNPDILSPVHLSACRPL